MPNIIKTHTYDDGQMIGWDADAGDWVELDKDMYAGSFVGNVGRAAAGGMAEIAQGVQELWNPSERTALEGEALAEQQAAAQRSAPVASALGNVVPDVTAGLAMTPFTGGLSVPAMLGTELLAGSVMGGIRPGSIDERVGRAAVGGLASVGGAALAPAAAAGVGSALRLFKNIEGETLSRIGREADQASVTLKEASQPAAPAGRSVGAAETPEELIGRTGTEAAEEAELQATEAAGAESLQPGFEKKLDRAIRDLGHTPTIGQGTRLFSPARLGQSTREFLPLGEAREASVRASNQANLVRKAATAVGDENAENVKRLDNTWFGQEEARIGTDFQSIERRLPAIDIEDYTKALGKIEQTHGLFGKMKGQMEVEKAIKAAESRMGAELTAKEVMSDRRYLSQKMSEFFRNGDTDDGKVLMDALNRLDNAIERAIGRNQYKKGLAEKWASARQQWQVLSMLKHGASTSGTGDINPTSLMKQLRKDRSNGGFGRYGPLEEGAARDLFDLTEVMVDAESHVPMTGMRQLIRMGSRIGANQLGIGGGALGAASLWD